MINQALSYLTERLSGMIGFGDDEPGEGSRHFNSGAKLTCQYIVLSVHVL